LRQLVSPVALDGCPIDIPAGKPDAYRRGKYVRNIELVEELLATVGRNDVERAVALCGPDLEFVDVLAPMEETVRDVRGEQGMRDWFAGLHEEGVKRVTAVPSDLQELEDGRVFGTVTVNQEKAGDSFSVTVYGIWQVRDGKLCKIDSFFDRALALKAAGLDDDGPTRRWVEGIVTAKIVERLAVRLRSAEHDGAEFSVKDAELWKEVEVGALGIAETDAGELVGWRPLRLRGD
jgi:ketosteroid isomerase-like protein